MSTKINDDGDAQKKYQYARINNWDSIARKQDSWKSWGRYYHRRLAEIFQFLIPPGQKIIEIGCSQGDLLGALKPSFGVGVDFSGEMLSRAARKHPELHFVRADAHALCFDETFDIIILSDLVNDLWDVQVCFQWVCHLTNSHTRVILNFYSHLWEPPLLLVQRLGLANPLLDQNWLTVEDVEGLLNLTDLEPVRRTAEVLLPLPIPLLNPFCNRFLAKIWPFYHGSMANIIVAKPFLRQNPGVENPTVSVIIPARNESGNISHIFERVPQMGRGTEIIFVEGHSTDDTFEVIQKTIPEYPDFRCKLLRQKGVGKGDAVRLGFAHAEGDILMILDADLTVLPDDLPRFYQALVAGKGEFINGVRLIYPMEEQAMRFLNLVGNKFFSWVFSWLLGQPVRDTLCGTKVLWKSDYEKIAANRKYFGDFDPFGDFDLLFGAAKLNLKIIDLPIRYRERTYGSTNIHRWKHGWLLLRMVLFAARRIKFI